MKYGGDDDHDFDDHNHHQLNAIFAIAVEIVGIQFVVKSSSILAQFAKGNPFFMIFNSLKKKRYHGSCNLRPTNFF